MSDPKSKKGNPKQMSAAQWAEAVALWELGEVSLSDLSEKYGLAKETFSRKFKKLGAVKSSRADAHSEQVKEKVAEAAITDATIHAERVKMTREEHIQWTSMLERLSMNEIAEARKEGRSFATSMSSLKSLEKAMQIIERGMNIKWKVLGLDDEDTLPEDLPDLVISELTASQVEEMRATGFGNITDESLGMTDLDDDIVSLDG